MVAVLNTESGSGPGAGSGLRSWSSSGSRAGKAEALDKDPQTDHRRDEGFAVPRTGRGTSEARG